MIYKCRVCGKPLRSERSRIEGAGPRCLKKERLRFGFGRRTPSNNQLSIDKKNDIIDHYKNNLDNMVIWLKDEGGKKYDSYKNLQRKCSNLWGNENFFEFIRVQYIKGNFTVDILKNYF